MKTANSLITLILLLTAVFSVVTSNSAYASTNGDEGGSENGNGNGNGNGGGEEEALPAEEPVEEQTPEEQQEINPEGYQRALDNADELGYEVCDNGEIVVDIDDCPEPEPELILCPDGITQVEDENDCPAVPPAAAPALSTEPAVPELAVPATLPPCDGSFQDCVTDEGFVCEAGSTAHECETEVTCPDGITEAQELSDCPQPEPVLPFPDDGDANNDGILDYYQEEDYEPNPYCDLVSDEYMASGGSCHDRKDYDQETLLYPCNDGTQKEDWRDCPDISDPCIVTPDLDECQPDPDPDPEPGPTGSGDNYDPKLPDADDLDCDVIDGTVKVIGEDVYDLDRDGDGTGCEANERGGDNNDNDTDGTKTIQKTTVINSASTTATSAEVSNCRLDGSADGILQKFDTIKYQACGLYIDGQKAYSDGFVAGCIQVGNTQLICQSLVDSSKLNVNMLTTQAATQPTQGIQPSAVNE